MDFFIQQALLNNNSRTTRTSKMWLSSIFGNESNKSYFINHKLKADRIQAVIDTI
jgi:lipid-A-disaccharide synthase-like uncharacterized protein